MSVFNISILIIIVDYRKVYKSIKKVLQFVFISVIIIFYVLSLIGVISCELN